MGTSRGCQQRRQSPKRPVLQDTADSRDLSFQADAVGLSFFLWHHEKNEGGNHKGDHPKTDENGAPAKDLNTKIDGLGGHKDTERSS